MMQVSGRTLSVSVGVLICISPLSFSQNLRASLIQVFSYF